MRSDIQNIVDKVHASMVLIRQRIGWEAAHTRLEELNARAEDGNLWNDPENAQKLMRERQNISNAIDEYKSMDNSLKDVLEMLELGFSEKHEEIIEDSLISLKALLTKAEKGELEALLNGEADSNDTFLR